MPIQRSARRSGLFLWIALIAALTLPAGCSTTQWLYRNVDWLLERYAVKSVDVNESQMQIWQPTLQQVLRRHRIAEIPLLERYLELMTRFADTSSDERVDAACLVRGATLIFSRHAQLAADLAAPLLTKLEPGQIEHLAEYLTQRRARFYERYLKGDESARRQARTLRLTDRIEGWTGALDSAQQARVEQLSAQLSDIASSWFEHRKNQEERLLKLLREGTDRERLHAHLLGWWLPWSGKSPWFSEHWTKAEAAFIQLLDDLASSVTNEQRQRYLDRVASLRSDLAALRGDTPQAVHEVQEQIRCHEQQI